MKILSFDVGIKNLAYCILSVEDNDFKILEWDVLNIIDNKKKVKEFSLKEIGSLLINKLDDNINLININKVIIENQPCMKKSNNEKYTNDVI